MIGPKASFTAAVEQEARRMEEDGRPSAVAQYQASMYEKKAPDGSQGEDSSKRSSNAVNRRSSVVGGQCPFGFGV